MDLLVVVHYPMRNSTSIKCCKQCVMKGESVCVGFTSILMVGIGLVCVCKLSSLCDACHEQKTKCKYPGKAGIGMGSGTGAGLPMKG